MLGNGKKPKIDKIIYNKAKIINIFLDLSFNPQRDTHQSFRKININHVYTHTHTHTHTHTLSNSPITMIKQ